MKRRDEDFAGLQSVHDAVKRQLEQQNGDLSSKLSKVKVNNIYDRVQVSCLDWNATKIASHALHQFPTLLAANTHHSLGQSVSKKHSDSIDSSVSCRCSCCICKQDFPCSTIVRLPAGSGAGEAAGGAAGSGCRRLAQ